MLLSRHNLRRVNTQNRPSFDCRKTICVALASQQIMRQLSPRFVAELEAHKERNVAQYTGTVKWFNNAKGYGFLGRDGGADVFVHYSSIQLEGYKSLKEGDEVEFDIIQGTKGPQADQVARLREA
jgi:CspA family cold shock protein